MLGVLVAAAAGHDDWQFVLSPRVSWRHHPMKISAVLHHVHRGQLPHVSPVPGKLKLFIFVCNIGSSVQFFFVSCFVTIL